MSETFKDKPVCCWQKGDDAWGKGVGLWDGGVRSCERRRRWQEQRDKAEHGSYMQYVHLKYFWSSLDALVLALVSFTDEGELWQLLVYPHMAALDTSW